jgi:multiple sugar transport system permease protein
MALQSTPVSKASLSLRQQDARTAWLLLAPSLLVLLGITLWPVISTLILSFFNAPTGINQARTFVGLSNYIGMLKDQIFWETIWQALGLAVPATCLDHSMGGAHHRQWSHVALDL